MKKAYKELYDGIKPGEQLMDSVFDMVDKKKKSKLVPKLASVVLAIAVLATGTGFGLQYHSNQKILNNPIGNVMIVDASEAIGKTTTQIGYRINVRDITGMTDEEIYNAKVELLKDMHISVKHKESLEDGLKNAVFVNGNALYSTERGGTELELTLRNIKNPKDVEKISVSNTSDYGTPTIIADDIYFSEPEENVFVFDNRNVDDSLGYIVGHNISLDGERYANCMRIDAKGAKHYDYDSYYNKDSEFYGMETTTSDQFYISYMFADEFFDALGKNPTMDLTTYNDELTVKVDFKDGHTATTVLQVSLTEKGKMTLKCLSYEYGKN